jgi:hypothetical protein
MDAGKKKGRGCREEEAEGCREAERCLLNLQNKLTEVLNRD